MELHQEDLNLGALQYILLLLLLLYHHYFSHQVVELHQEDLNLGALQCIHIGCDEVWCLGQGVETRY